MDAEMKSLEKAFEEAYEDAAPLPPRRGGEGAHRGVRVEVRGGVPDPGAGPQPLLANWAVRRGSESLEFFFR